MVLTNTFIIPIIIIAATCKEMPLSPKVTTSLLLYGSLFSAPNSVPRETDVVVVQIHLHLQFYTASLRHCPSHLTHGSLQMNYSLLGLVTNISSVPSLRQSESARKLERDLEQFSSFSEVSRVCPAHRHKQTDHGTCQICSNRPHPCDACDAV